MWRYTYRAIAVVSTFWAASAAAWTTGQEATLTGLGDLPGGQVFSESFGVSADGEMAVGGSYVYQGTFPLAGAFRWSAEDGLQSIFQNPAIGASFKAFGVSGDGASVVGNASFAPFDPLGKQAFLWTEADGPVLLGDLPGGVSGTPQSGARGVSADGNFIIGTGESASGQEAFRYNVDTGAMQGLGDLPGGLFGSYGLGVSANGNVVVGSSFVENQYQQAFRWAAGTGIVGLGFLPTPPSYSKFSQADAANADGSVVVGASRSNNAPTGSEAYRWTAAGGMEPLGDLSGGDFISWAYGVSADGSVIVGRGTIAGPNNTSLPRAFIWDAEHGMRNLETVLTSEYGLDLGGWKLQEARAVSADGSTIVGNGVNPAGNGETWMVSFSTTGPALLSSNPPLDNPYKAGTQPYRDVLQTGPSTALTHGIGAAGTPNESTMTYSTITAEFGAAFDAGLSPATVQISCTGGDCPSISAISGSGAGPYLISLSGAIPPMHCTTLTFPGGAKLQYQSLPGDVNMSGTAALSDTMALLGAIQNGSAYGPSKLARYDINRSGAISSADVLRLVQLLNGTNAPEAYQNDTVVTCP